MRRKSVKETKERARGRTKSREGLLGSLDVVAVDLELVSSKSQSCLLGREEPTLHANLPSAATPWLVQLASHHASGIQPREGERECSSKAPIAD